MAEAEGNKLRGKAVLSCFVKSASTPMYAVVCKHATHTANYEFFFQDKSHRLIPVARKLKRGMLDTETFNDYDIDIIKIKKGKGKLCRPVFRNSKGYAQNDNVRIYNGSIEDLYKETVFMSVQADTENKFIIRSGDVLLPENINEVIRDSYSMSTHFVVGNKDNSTFAEEGDSGRLVVREKEAYLELIGIVVQKDKDQTVCLLLKKGLEYLSRKYRLQLSLFKTSDHTCGESDVIETVEPGATLTFLVNK